MLIMKNKGVTLIELLVVLSVIGVLLLAMAFSFQGWRGKYAVESQIKELSVDLMNTRARAMQRNRIHFVRLTTTSYAIYEDTNPVPDGNGTLETATDTRIIAKNLDPGSPIAWSASADIQFTQRGFSDAADNTICSNTNFDADYDCIEISLSRINSGKLTTALPAGGACDSTNCVAK